jgi:hypothetical protein
MPPGTYTHNQDNRVQADLARSCMHYTLTSVMSLSMMPLPLLYPKTLWDRCVVFKPLSLLSHFPPIYHRFWYQTIHQRFKTAVLTRIIIIIIAVLALCYFTMSHATLILCYHTTVGTLYNLLRIMCTLVATCVRLGGGLECNTYYETWS